MIAMFGWFNEARTFASRWNLRQSFGVSGERLGQDLDGDVAIEPRVARPIHLTHSAGPKGREDLVLTEARARSEGQRVGV